MMHELKTDPISFQQIHAGLKCYELRRADRPFSVGDTLLLRETTYSKKEMDSGLGLSYTGRQLLASVTHIIHGPKYGLADGWVIMSIKSRF